MLLHDFFSKDDLLDQFETTHEDRWWSRITSYNVCYTKLLRKNGKSSQAGNMSYDIVDLQVHLRKGFMDMLNMSRGYLYHAVAMPEQ